MLQKCNITKSKGVYAVDLNKVGSSKKMKKKVTVIAVCLACVIMAGFDVKASATKAATKEDVNKVTLLDNSVIEEVFKNKISTSDNLSNEGTVKKQSNKVKTSKTKKHTVSTANISGTAVTEKKKGAAKNKEKKYTQGQLKYMTCIIYCEARGEVYAGQMAVGIVVMNRVRSGEFPDTIKKVIYQRGQFTPAHNGGLSRALSLYEKYDKKGKFKGEMVSCYKAAKEVLSGTTKVKVNGEEKEMKSYLYFSQRVSGAKYTLGGHQFK